MSLSISTSEVRAVLLAVGWQEVVPGSFRLGDLVFSAVDGEAPDVAGGQSRPWPAELGFEFEATDGGLVAGPLSSVLAVSYAAPRKPVGSSFEQVAAAFEGEVVIVDGEQAVYFGYGSREFELWLDAQGQWAFALRGHRTGGRDVVAHTGLYERDVSVLPSVVMGEIKGGFGRGSRSLGEEPGASGEEEQHPAP